MKRQIIIGEGADLTGKTTILKKLSEKLKIPYYKGDGPSKITECMKTRSIIELTQLLGILEQTNYSMIIDRSWLSELVYGTFFDRRPAVDFLKIVDEKFAALGATVLLVVTDKKSMETRYKIRGEDMLIPDDCHKIQQRFIEAAGKMKTRHIQVANYNDVGTIDDTVKTVIKKLKEIQNEN